LVLDNSTTALAHSVANVGGTDGLHISNGLTSDGNLTDFCETTDKHVLDFGIGAVDGVSLFADALES